LSMALNQKDGNYIYQDSTIEYIWPQSAENWASRPLCHT
jgi:hypothetical protein